MIHIHLTNRTLCKIFLYALNFPRLHTIISKGIQINRMAMKYNTIIITVLLLFIAACKSEDNPVVAEGPSLGNITGIITDAETGNVIPQVLVVTENSTSSVISDIDGIFYIKNVAPGNYSLIASKNEYSSSRVNVRVDSGITTQADIVLSKIQDPVFGRLNGKIINASDDTGIVDAVVTLSGLDEENTYNLTKITSSDGSYTFDELPPGDYVVSASKYDFVTKDININIIADSTSFAAIMLMPKYGKITGIVTDKTTNLPVSGALIATTPATNTVTTDDNGSYTIDYAPTVTGTSVNYTVTASHDGYTNASVQVNVNPGRTATANIQM